MNAKSLCAGATAALLVLGSVSAVNPAPSRIATGPEPLPLHCQVPCGIYGDSLRVELLMEDADTIEKGMKSLLEMDGQENPSKNQMVRWVMNKDEHAAAIQEQVASYWLAQRVKAPGEDAREAEHERYVELLKASHEMTVQAMKCKQTTEVVNVDRLRRAVRRFSTAYFTAEELEHIRGHRGDDKR